MDRLRQGAASTGREAGIVAVLFLDLDRFKVINDSLGHRVGDDVLQAGGRAAPEASSAGGHPRLGWGATSSSLVAEGLPDERAAVELGNRVTQAGREPYRVGEEEFVCTVSVGIATTADASHGAERLLQEAELALYRAKDRGRDRAEVFDEELRTTAVGRLGTERMVRRAIAEQRLRVQYQPIFDVQSGHLVRRRGPGADLRTSPMAGSEPAAFLEVAEEAGLLDHHRRVGPRRGRAARARAWHVRFGATGFSAWE